MRNAARKYLEVFPEEKARLAGFENFLAAVSNPVDFLNRQNFNGHITASGFVLSPDGRKLLLVKHKFLGRYLQPGGHVEASDESVLAAARREIAEETGLAACRYLPFHADTLLPMDIDTHEIPANPKKNEAKHFHHDFRFLFCASSQETCNAEEMVWRDLEGAIDDATFKLVAAKIKQRVG